ncbi:MAG: 2-amino-4-hydroxy-6-hydroxymethyldihydropteridine diphosphokinase [Rhodopirellula sp.]|nr:2-amino-4-hydroxy-6-hydroxymethyldihydropteridine diphosphokinase [Rhodopirellula sp.]
MVQAVVALGGNVGNVARTFDRARAIVEQGPEVTSVRTAGLFRSKAMGADAGDEFFNSAWVVETSLKPHSLLDRLQRVENELGRTREVHWGPRTLDLDLIFYDDEQIDSPRLTVPHPHCWYRRFVLTPIETLLPEFKHPGLGLTIRELSQRLAQETFHLVLGSLDAIPDSLKSVAADFPGVKVTRVESADDADTLQVSLAVWFQDFPVEPLPPLWVPASVTNAEQELRDILTAACTRLESVG